ncbi:uncharacterized protein [Argopecten irradians]|uniref:uncharacterized protein n=1 Tax=Argopecten irradians TaxID=31199 RepID=UPI00371E7DEA
MPSHHITSTKDDGLPAIVNFLMRKELASSRLTTFNDWPDSYLCWRTTFQSVMKEASVTPGEELDLLVKWLGPISSTYASSIRSSNGSDPVLGRRRLLWERLDERYGSPEAVEAALRTKLESFPKLIDKSKMYELADVLTEILVLKDDPNYHQILSHYDSPLGLRQVLTKLPTRVQSKWTDRAFSYKATKHVAFPPFSYFVSFIKDMARMMNDPGLMFSALDNVQGRGSGPNYSRGDRGPGVKVKKTGIQKESPAQTSERCCPIHPESSTHSLEDCREFLRRTLSDRRQFLKDKSICYKCCSSDKHIRKDCNVQVKCSECGSRKHITALHQPQNNSERKDVSDHKAKQLHGGEGQDDVNSKCTAVCGEGFHGRSCAKVVLVRVYSENEPERAVSAYALLDDQSNRSLASSELLDTLGVTGDAIDYTLSSCSGNFKCSGRKVKGLVVQTSNGSDSFCLPQLIECNSIPSDDSEIPTPEIVSHFSHLDSIASCLPEYRSDCSIGLLIGRDVPEAHHIHQQITGPRGSPFAQKTRLGWVIVGEVCLNKVHPPDEPVRISSFKTNVMNRHLSLFTPCINNLRLQESIIYDPLFLKTKDDEIPAWSVEDREFVDLMNRECVQENGFWTAPLPFRKGMKTMPNNRSVALKRAMILDTSLKKDLVKRQHFISFMEKVISSGAAEVAPPTKGEVWYLPIFGIYNSKKPGKIRGVFDSSAEFKGVSLNKHLLSGPNLTNSLLAILLRFRRDKYAASADIEQMFYRFLVKEEHRDYLRFLWYRDNNPDLDLIEYRMRAHAFGNSPSPAIATFALRKGVEGAYEDVRSFVTNNFYVDDALTSGPEAKCVSDFMHRTQRVLKQNGNIRLHKVASNSVEIVKSFPSEDLGEDLKPLDFQVDSLPTQSSLGVSWNMAKDTFQFDVHLSVQSESRREMLSTLNSIFDPIGFLTPFTIQGRILLRELTSGTDWDTPLPGEHQRKWDDWKTSLKKLKDVQSPRMYTPVSTSTAKDVQLHVYCDASESAVAAVAYLKIKDDGTSHVGFVMGKAKLAPSKGHSIPRLELCATVLAIEVGEIVCRTLSIQDVRYHSDSRVVLGYIDNRTRRFYTYVANREERILQSSQPSQWKYVSTAMNPADQATRSSARVDGFESSIWLRGPKQLQEDTESASSDVYDLVEPKDDKEIRPEVAVVSRKTVVGGFCARFERFSKWRRFVNVVLRIKQLVQRFRKNKRISADQPVETPLTRVDSEVTIIRQAQKSDFEEEISDLCAGKQVSKTSSIKGLDPYLDDAGLLRVGGRLKASNLPIKETNPLILSRKHHVSHLIVQHYHECVHHQGRVITEGALRNNGYWIVGAKRLIGKVINKCVSCRKLRGKLEHQKMADLPQDRLTPGPPFTAVGIDTFGPWSVVARKTRGGSANSKRWAILFTCLTTRAIHVEVVESMSSACFINALRRFVALRGNVKEIRSDCGTNFVGAVNELGLTSVNVGDESISGYLDD